MTNAEKIEMLKVDLGISTRAYDERLGQYIASAEAEITREGITLQKSSVDDSCLVIMYAAWMWRKRDGMEGMPRMLRYALNNRIMSEKMKV